MITSACHRLGTAICTVAGIPSVSSWITAAKTQHTIARGIQISRMHTVRPRGLRHERRPERRIQLLHGGNPYTEHSMMCGFFPPPVARLRALVKSFRMKHSGVNILLPDQLSTQHLTSLVPRCRDFVAFGWKTVDFPETSAKGPHRDKHRQGSRVFRPLPSTNGCTRTVSA